MSSRASCLGGAAQRGFTRPGRRASHVTPRRQQSLSCVADRSRFYPRYITMRKHKLVASAAAGRATTVARTRV